MIERGRSRRRRKGTSLVEVMIGMAILAIVLLAFLSIMSSASSTSAGAKENAIALYILQSTVEDTFVGSYSFFYNKYLTTPVPTPPASPLTPPFPWLASPSGLFVAVTSDANINGSMTTLQALLPRVQGTPPPLTGAEQATWSTIVNHFKQYPYPLQATGRLKNEAINLYLMPTSDLYKGGGFNLQNVPDQHKYTEYMIEITWTDVSGKPRHESITTRRSQ